MRILYYGESPMNPTGFGHVNRMILDACSRVASVTCVATTHYAETYDYDLYPYTIIGCPLDPVPERTQTHQRNLPNIMTHLKDYNSWDVFFYQGDMGWNNDVLAIAGEIQKAHPEKQTIFYMPIDGDVSIPDAFLPFTWCSVPVVYTEHAKSIVAKYAPSIAENVSVIGLGCETDVFKPLFKKRELRLKFFGEKYADRFVALNVNRNQPRKDLARCMAAFHLFHRSHPDSTLYMHSVMDDAAGSLLSQAVMAGCDVHADPAEIIFSSLDLSKAWARTTLNELYNACDVLVSTAHGEGWGLATTEAMSAGIPVLVPLNTANLDIIGMDQERGWGIQTGGDLDHTAFLYQYGASHASIIHSQSFVDQLSYIYDHREEAMVKADKALNWAQVNTWERRKQQWQNLLTMMKS